MVTYSIVAATFVGSAYVLMTRGHVNVDVLPLHLKPRARFWLALFATICWRFGFCVVLFVLCTRLLVRGLVEGLAFRHGLARAACGFPIFRCRSGSACWCCNTSPS